MSENKKGSERITFRSFASADAAVLCRFTYSALSVGQAEDLIAQWNTKQFQGRYFEMFAVVADGEIVGMISLYQHTADVISIGPEIFAPYRRRGYAKAALRYACEIAAEKGYRTVSQQIRTENTASIALHRLLGFETDGAVIINAKGNAVCIYHKALL